MRILHMPFSVCGEDTELLESNRVAVSFDAFMEGLY